MRLNCSNKAVNSSLLNEINPIPVTDGQKDRSNGRTNHQLPLKALKILSYFMVCSFSKEWFCCTFHTDLFNHKKKWRKKNICLLTTPQKGAAALFDHVLVIKGIVLERETITVIRGSSSLKAELSLDAIKAMAASYIMAYRCQWTLWQGH